MTYGEKLGLTVSSGLESCFFGQSTRTNASNWNGVFSSIVGFFSLHLVRCLSCVYINTSTGIRGLDLPLTLCMSSHIQLSEGVCQKSLIKKRCYLDYMESSTGIIYYR
jgi:hypothetical protein